ncbi:prepilin-type N-terminal cleavage/methylation domain-containing protein [Candidatus Halobeggiatoa sp. HSG11]|nr:prepilin-type N-terminal cleavage/methylation domain-containing protein [Candidatus Halobeggiatoa sp. HSG11]
MISSVGKSNNTGFTLLELIIVMVIVGMMAMLVVPNVGTSQGAILKAQVREAMAVLRYTRRAATIQGKQKTIILKEGGESAQKTNVDSGVWTSRGVSLQRKQSDDNDDKSEKNNISTEVSFYPEGGSSGGKIVFTFNKHTAEIEINPLTGKIKSDIFADDDEEEKK